MGVTFRTYKTPCIGCGNNSMPRKGMNQICPLCEAYIKEGQRSIENKNRKREYAFVMISWAAHNLPYLSGGKAGDTVRELFYELVELIAVNTETLGELDRVWFLSGESDDSYRTEIVVEKRFIEPLEKLYRAIRDLVLQVGSDSKQEGLNILTQLARGEISIDQFNDRSTGIPERTQEELERRQRRREQVDNKRNLQETEDE